MQYVAVWQVVEKRLVSVEWLLVIAALLAAGLSGGVAVLTLRGRARRQPVLQLKVARWGEPGWYLIGLGLANRWRVTLTTTELEATAPRRARLLERAFLERYAVPGPDGIRRPEAAAATRAVPFPMEAGPAGARVLLQSYAGETPQYVAADRDHREVLLYLPPSARTQEVKVTLHYILRNRPDRRQKVRLALEIPGARQ